jgi:hypothetical protein
MACDSRPDPRLKLALSRTAHRDVFALRVFLGNEAMVRRQGADRSEGLFVAALPGG